MNQIVTINQPSTLTMSSLEIATLTEKDHKNVLADIRKMFTELNFQPSDFAGTYIDPTGRKLPCFNLPKRETTILVSGYSVVLRARIVDRWMELEEQVRSTPITPALPDFSDPVAAARAWAEQFEQRRLADAKVKELEEPAAAGVLVMRQHRALQDVAGKLTGLSTDAGWRHHHEPALE